MSKRRGHHEGGIDSRGENCWRLRYRVNGRRFTRTVHGTKSDAQKELRRLLYSGDAGTHVAPDRMTVEQWVERWIAIGAPGRRQKRVGRRTVERYSQLLRCHVLPALRGRRLQEVQATDIDALYVNLGSRLTPGTACYVHAVLNACLGTAVRKGLISSNPMMRVENVPAAIEAEHGRALDADELRELIEGFRGSPLFPIVVTACLTGARRGEILALRWADLDSANRTLRIERAVEKTKNGLAFKPPKNKRGTRTIVIDDELVALLSAERQKHMRIMAGVPERASVDLSLVKLPEGALMFPSPLGSNVNFMKPRDPLAVTRGFVRRARKLGFIGLRFHDLRGSHETLLLDQGIGVHVVAARCGHDPAVLLRSYAKRTKKADTTAASVIGTISKGILR